jgi:hypothetical protein
VSESAHLRGPHREGTSKRVYATPLLCGTPFLALACPLQPATLPDAAAAVSTELNTGQVDGWMARDGRVHTAVQTRCERGARRPPSSPSCFARVLPCLARALDQSHCASAVRRLHRPD